MVQLTTLARNATGTVAGVRVDALGADGALDPAVERMALRLIEIGFVQGAHAARDRVRPAGRRPDRRARGRARRRQHVRAAAPGGRLRVGVAGQPS